EDPPPRPPPRRRGGRRPPPAAPREPLPRPRRPHRHRRPTPYVPVRRAPPGSRGNDRRRPPVSLPSGDREKMSNAALTYFEKTAALLESLRKTQLPAIEKASELCADRISKGGLVFLFGNGHSRMMCE